MRQLRSIQLSSAINNTELSFAQQLPVEKKDYDFIPRIWKTNIGVKIDDFVYFAISFSAFCYSLDVFYLFHRLFKQYRIKKYLVATGNRTQDRLYTVSALSGIIFYIARSFFFFIKDCN